MRRIPIVTIVSFHLDPAGGARVVGDPWLDGRLSLPSHGAGSQAELPLLLGTARLPLTPSDIRALARIPDAFIGPWERRRDADGSPPSQKTSTRRAADELHLELDYSTYMLLEHGADVVSALPAVSLIDAALHAPSSTPLGAIEAFAKKFSERCHRTLARAIDGMESNIELGAADWDPLGWSRFPGGSSQPYEAHANRVAVLWEAREIARGAARVQILVALSEGGAGPRDRITP